MVKKENNENKSRTRLYRIWSGMKQRCNNPNNTRYKYYGQRGITVCNEWLNSFDNFERWALDNRYDNYLTLDRREVNGNYSPGNCRWSTTIVQGNNKTNSVFVEGFGEKKTMSEWSKDSRCQNVGREGLSFRLNLGLSLEEAISTIPQKGQSFNGRKNNVLLTAFSETKSLSEWSKDPRCKVKYCTLDYRFHNCKNMTPEDMMELPTQRGGGR